MKDLKKLKNLLTGKPALVIYRLILGGIFITASVDKILDPGAFAGILHNYQILPASLIHAPALILPWLELMAGAFLIAGIFVRGSALVLTSLLVIFIAAISANLFRGIVFDCGCFSLRQNGGGNAWLLLVRDILLLAPGILIFLFHQPEEKK